MINRRKFLQRTANGLALVAVSAHAEPSAPILLGGALYSPNRYVVANADGTGDGSVSDPWTLQQAMANAVAGDVVQVGPGIYTGATTGSRFGPSFSPSNSGMLGSPITFFAEHRAGTTYQDGFTSELRCGTSSMGNGNPAFGSASRDYIIFDGFFVDERNSAPRADTGPVTFSGCTGCEIRSCVILGILHNWSSNHCGVRFENAYECRATDNYIDGFDSSGSQNSAGIMTYVTQNSVFEHNQFERCAAGIFVKGDHTQGTQYGNIIRFNVFTDNLYADIHIGGVYYSPVNPNLIYGNLIKGTGGFSGLYVRSYDGTSPDNVWIVNNTVYNREAFLISPSSVSSLQSGGHCFNNIVHTIHQRGVYGSFTTGDTAVHLDWFEDPIDYNLYYNYGSLMYTQGSGTMQNTSFQNWQSTYRQDLNGLNGADPLFLSNGSDFRLSTNSLARNAGIDVLNLLGGGTSAPIDLGCYFSTSIPGRRI